MQGWGGSRDAGIVNVIVQPILKTADEEVLRPVVEPACQVTEFFGVLSCPSATLSDGLDAILLFAVSQGVLKSPPECRHEAIEVP